MTESGEQALISKINHMGGQLAQLSSGLQHDREMRADFQRLQDERSSRLERRTDHLEEMLEQTADYSQKTWASRHWPQVIFLMALVPTISLIFGAGLWTLYGGDVVEFLRQEIASQARKEAIIYEPPRRSFIRSPVHVGGDAEFVLVSRRNEGWGHCTYETVRPLFFDQNGNFAEGEFTPKGRQYLEGQMELAELIFRVPDSLTPGTTRLAPQIIYDCNGVQLIHALHEHYFQLKPMVQEAPQPLD